MKAPFRKVVCALATLAAAAPASYAHIGEVQKITASDGVAGDRFGASIALDHLTSVVGAPGNGAGSAYVFDSLPFTEQSKLTPSDGLAGDSFGHSVSISGDTAVVGAPQADDFGISSGSSYVYTRTGTVWTEQAKLLPPAGAMGDSFGWAVGISGETIVIGAPGDDSAATNGGAAYVFVRSGTVWSLQATLTAADANADDELGLAVSIDGDTVVLGAPSDSDVQPSGGSVYIFDRVLAVWSLDVKLTNASVGSGDGYGTAVDITDLRIVVGAPKDDDHVPDGGVLFLYDDIAGTWTLTQTLVTTHVTVPFAECGSSVAVDANAILGGAPRDMATQGQVYFWAAQLSFREDIMWATDGAPGDQFGVAVAIADCWAVSGAPYENANGVDAGAAYVHALKHPQELYCTSGTSASGCVPRIGAKGFASTTATSGFRLFALDFEGGKDGMFFIGVNGRQANPWGNGTSYQCVVPPVWRGGVLDGQGTEGLCDNSIGQDWNALWCPPCPKPAKNPGAGAKVQAQFWYRDPYNTSNQTTSLTNAIEFELCP